MDDEIWKDIPGYEGLYQVSSLGRVKSLDRNIKHAFGGYSKRKGMIKKPQVQKDGYVKIPLCKDGVNKNFLIHRLVAMAFIPNTENKEYVDHINTIRNDNRVENLRWATEIENGNNILTIKKRSKMVKCITTGEIFKKVKEAAQKYNIDKSDISKCCKGKKKDVKGYKFEYYKEEK